ncbi:MAG: hypothetical protein CW346_04650 [Bacillaceae bacterium]|nr:hypothetical protein [Bacillaceae bacterium]
MACFGDLAAGSERKGAAGPPAGWDKGDRRSLLYAPDWRSRRFAAFPFRGDGAKGSESGPLPSEPVIPFLWKSARPRRSTSAWYGRREKAPEGRADVAR